MPPDTDAPAPAPAGAGGLARWAVPAIVAAFIVLAGLLFWRNATTREFPWVNHDVAFLTYTGLEILHGARLYVDVQEMNPPGSHFLYAAVVAVADRLGVSEIFAGHALVLMLALFGLLLLRNGLARGRDGLAAVLVPLAYAVLVVRANFSNNVLPSAPSLPYDFGQREHLFAILFLPYVVWRGADSRPRPVAYAYLVLLGFVTAFKPYWIAFVAAVELVRGLRDRRTAPGVYGALGAGLVAPYVILGLDSWRSVTAFLGDVVPWVLGGAYSYYDTSFARFVLTPLHLQMVAGAAVFGLCWWGCYRGRLLDRGRLWLMAAIVAGAYLSMLHQHRFWSYHGTVYFGAVVVLSTFLFAVLVSRRTRGAVQLLVTASAMVMLLAVAGSSILNLRTMLDRYPPKGSELVTVLRGSRSAMFFSLGADYAYAPLILRMKSVGPWREHFRLPALLAMDRGERRERALEDYARRIRAEIDRERPEVLVFARAFDGPGIHEALQRYGVVPRPDYVRIPDEWLMGRDARLAQWIAYRKVGKEGTAG